MAGRCGRSMRRAGGGGSSGSGGVRATKGTPHEPGWEESGPGDDGCGEGKLRPVLCRGALLRGFLPQLLRPLSTGETDVRAHGLRAAEQLAAARVRPPARLPEPTGAGADDPRAGGRATQSAGAGGRSLDVFAIHGRAHRYGAGVRSPLHTGGRIGLATDGRARRGVHAVQVLIRGDPMSEPQAQTGHPKGTLFLMALYGLVFVASWLSVYVFVYLRRGGVTP